MRKARSFMAPKDHFAWLWVALAVLIGGCGDDDLEEPMACGAGTTMIGGVCQRMIQCGQGTELVND
ncbi:MAG: hypothetical protein JW797_01450, partial [Bradymonadales bacterium]|nr:hypothetical protein [Bradymonadales bacterium]